MDPLVGDGRGVEDIYPLTPLQSGLLFHSLVDRRRPVLRPDRRPAVRRRRPARFPQAWQQVADRTPVLRTAAGGAVCPQPVQVVLNRAELPVTHLDWRQLPPDQWPAETDSLLAADRAAGMELTSAPLTRLTLAALPDDELSCCGRRTTSSSTAGAPAQLLTEVCEHYVALTGGTQRRPPPAGPSRTS